MISDRVAIVVIFLTSAPVGLAASAQPVLLQIRPRIGDTLAVRLDQKVEMTGTPVGCVAANPAPRSSGRQEARAQLCSDASRQMTNVMEVFSRAIVRNATKDDAVILAVTDSVRTSSTGGSGRPLPPRRVAASKSTMEVRLATDGAAEIVNADASDELRAIFGQMPAMLSRKPVSVGEKWTRQMRMPISGESGAIGLVRATFQLDSLGGNGDIAYISMRGTLSHDHRDGSDSELGGRMSGSMELDRRLAWFTETRAVIDVTSIVKPTSGGAPMRVRTKVTQLLRAGRAR